MDKGEGSFPFPSFSVRIYREVQSVLTKTNLSFQNPGILHILTDELLAGNYGQYGTPWGVTQL